MWIVNGARIRGANGLFRSVKPGKNRPCCRKRRGLLVTPIHQPLNTVKQKAAKLSRQNISLAFFSMPEIMFQCFLPATRINTIFFIKLSLTNNFSPV